MLKPITAPRGLLAFVAFAEENTLWRMISNVSGLTTVLAGNVPGKALYKYVERADGKS